MESVTQRMRDHLLRSDAIRQSMSSSAGALMTAGGLLLAVLVLLAGQIATFRGYDWLHVVTGVFVCGSGLFGFASLIRAIQAVSFAIGGVLGIAAGLEHQSPLKNICRPVSEAGDPASLLVAYASLTSDEVNAILAAELLEAARWQQRTYICVQQAATWLALALQLMLVALGITLWIGLRAAK
jgi:hypothetical protein